MTLVWGWDATAADLGSVPAGQGAGYTTELPNADGSSPGIKWSDTQFAEHPGALRIDQDANAADATADVLDVETFAATPSEVAGWVTRARASFDAGTRPGQRRPCIYVNRGNETAVANDLVAAGITPPVPFWLANPNLTMDEAAAMVTAGAGPFPIVGVQFADRGAYDADVWDAGWLSDVSAGATPPPVPPSADPLAERLSAMPELAEGATGPAVGTLQSLLRNRGFHLGTSGADHNGVDRDFGPLTHSAVIAFQQEQGIADDGIVGPVTWPLLPLS